ncbi:hypothetical protein CH381_23125 [Leptospira sp. mixed culture ATI2-C-A1]|nr:hypothetical protein CH381_23125 [Leptospira sp. mixed culture ATI2-C-A1]
MKSEDKIIKPLLILFTLVSAIILGIWTVKSSNSGYKLNSQNLDLNYAASLGSFLSGTIGLFLSAFAVYLIYTTYRLQKEELSETKKILRLQNFDQTFFNLADSINFLVEKMYISKSKTVYIKAISGFKPKTNVKEFSGYEFLRFFKELFFELFQSVKNSGNLNESKISQNLVDFLEIESHIVDAISDSIKLINEEGQLSYLYLICHNKLESSIGNYFRSIYQCLKLIKQLEDEGHKLEAKNYANIFQARFNSWELTLLFYNSLSFKKLKDLLDHFEFLDNLYIEDLIDKKHKEYSKSIKKSRNSKIKDLLV